ncbi:5'-nucleotidase-like [Tubulanus polymorphus]|uniref:5'-nucleotidase-like n=1 Tax=Tubulanus polymorphus TaxID=672921 RepID=UPI003DA55A62
MVESFKLTLFHTNDVHSRFEEANKFGGSCNPDKPPCFGGAARRMTKLKELRRKYPNNLFLDGGDQYQGTFWFYVYKGRAAVHFMNLLQYDAMAFGNHEFDNGVDGLLPLIKNASFPLLNCNIDASNEPKLNGKFKKSTILKVGGERIGVIGYTTRDTPELAKPGKTLLFGNEIEAIKGEVIKLKKAGVNKIVAVGHAGFNFDKEIARNVNGIDVIIGGHTNTFLYSGPVPSNDKAVDTYPYVVRQSDGNQVLIVQDFAYGKYLGCLHVEFDKMGKIINWTGNPFLLDSTVPKDPDVLREIQTWAKPLIKLGKEVVGKSHVLLDGQRSQCRMVECNMGNMITDAMVYRNLRPSDSQWTNASIAMWNGGSIRASIHQGPIEVEMVRMLVPYANTIDMVELQGKYLQEVLEHSVSKYNYEDPDGRFMQYSGIWVTYNLTAPIGQRFVKAKVRCAKCLIPKFEPLDQNEIYSILLPSYIVKGGDGYTMIPEKAKKIHLFGDLDSDVLLKYIKERSPIYTGLEHRITMIK